MKKLIVFIFISVSLLGCEVLKQIEMPAQQTLTTSDIIAGLKQALEIGTNNSVSFLGKADGFYGNPLFKIPFPEEAKVVEEKLRDLGMHRLLDDFIRTMNRGAENAVKLAAPIFVDAIKQMSFDDARNILRGPDDAATEYFRSKTSDRLAELFKPEVQSALDRVDATKYWGDITTTYNRIPFVKRVETDLSKYVTEKTMNALFTKVAEEEKLIRTDPAARVTDLLKKVFGQ
jgi:hypothetical protein